MTSSGAARARYVADRPKAVADTAPGCEPAHPKGPVHWAATGARLVGRAGCGAWAPPLPGLTEHERDQYGYQVPEPGPRGPWSGVEVPLLQGLPVPGVKVVDVQRTVLVVAHHEVMRVVRHVQPGGLQHLGRPVQVRVVHAAAVRQLPEPQQCRRYLGTQVLPDPGGRRLHLAGGCGHQLLASVGAVPLTYLRD